MATAIQLRSPLQATHVAAVLRWSGMTPQGRRSRRRYVIAFGALTASAVFSFTQDLARMGMWNDPTPAWRMLVSWLVGMWNIMLLLPGVFWMSEYVVISRARWPRGLALHVSASLAFAMVSLALGAAFYTWLGFLGGMQTTSYGQTLHVAIALSFQNAVITYWVIWGIDQSIRTYRKFQDRERDALKLELRTAELGTQLARAQLGALKTQLQPHFLFNTLNAIMVLVRQQRSDEAEATLARLSELLRGVLADALAQEVPLHRELEHLRLYLDIEQLRFRDRLRTEIEIPPDLLDATVPHLGLQPLIENAIRHGIGGSVTAGSIAIRAARQGDTLSITVSDDGPGLGAAPATQGHGIGLANVRARLAQLYGGAGTLTVDNGPAGGAVATLTVPFRIAQEAA